jgi:RecJ-like exonuclease
MSHKEDVDGLASAALVKAAFDTTSTVLCDYPSLIPRLEKLAGSEKKIEKLFICVKKERSKVCRIAGKAE